MEKKSCVGIVRRFWRWFWRKPSDAEYYIQPDMEHKHRDAVGMLICYISSDERDDHCKKLKSLLIKWKSEIPNIKILEGTCAINIPYGWELYILFKNDDELTKFDHFVCKNGHQPEFRDVLGDARRGEVKVYEGHMFWSCSRWHKIFEEI